MEPTEKDPVVEEYRNAQMRARNKELEAKNKEIAGLLKECTESIDQYEKAHTAYTPKLKKAMIGAYTIGLLTGALIAASIFITIHK